MVRVNTTDARFMEAVRQQLVAERAASGYTKQDAAKAANVGRTTLHYIEDGEREPGVKQVMALCAVYGVDVSTFFARAEARMAD